MAPCQFIYWFLIISLTLQLWTIPGFVHGHLFFSVCIIPLVLSSKLMVLKMVCGKVCKPEVHGPIPLLPWAKDGCCVGICKRDHMWPAEPKIFTICLFIGKKCHPLIYRVVAISKFISVIWTSPRWVYSTTHWISSHECLICISNYSMKPCVPFTCLCCNLSNHSQ